MRAVTVACIATNLQNSVFRGWGQRNYLFDQTEEFWVSETSEYDYDDEISFNAGHAN